MKWERLELLGWTVDDLDAAVATFAELFGVQFHVYTAPDDIDFENLPVPGNSAANLHPTTRYRIAIDTAGYFELVENRGGPETFRNIHFKVDDLAAAKEDLTTRGHSLVAEYRAGSLREAVFESLELRGIRLCLVEYDAPSAIAAILERSRESAVDGAVGI